MHVASNSSVPIFLLDQKNKQKIPDSNLDLAPFAFTVRALRARTVNAGFGGAKRRRNQLVENAARSELTFYRYNQLPKAFAEEY
jgi:hypothetical protein